MTTEIVMLFLGVAIAEGTEVAPWLAKRLVRWSARIRYLDRSRAEVRAEEWEAVINSMPGKATKLVRALPFLIGASIAWANRTVLLLSMLRAVRGEQKLPPATNAPIRHEVLAEIQTARASKAKFTIYTLQDSQQQQWLDEAMNKVLSDMADATAWHPASLDSGSDAIVTHPDGSIEFVQLKLRMGPPARG